MTVIKKIAESEPPEFEAVTVYVFSGAAIVGVPDIWPVAEMKSPAHAPTSQRLRIAQTRRRVDVWQYPCIQKKQENFNHIPSGKGGSTVQLVTLPPANAVHR